MVQIPQSPYQNAVLRLVQALDCLQNLSKVQKNEPCYDQLLDIVEQLIAQFKTQQERLNTIKKQVEKLLSDLSLLIIMDDKEVVSPYLTQYVFQKYQYQKIELARYSLTDIKDENDLLLGIFSNPTVQQIKQLAKIQSELPVYLPIGVLAQQLTEESRRFGHMFCIQPMICQPLSRGEVDNYILAHVKHRKNIEANLFTKLFGSLGFSERRKPPFLSEIDSFIEAHLDGLTIKSLCQATNFSRSHLSRKVKALTGLKLTQYINYYRLEKSKLLLSDTEWTICRISDTLGFCSQQYFTLLFSKRFGMSPSKYRMAIKVN